MLVNYGGGHVVNAITSKVGCSILATIALSRCKIKT